MEGLSSIDQPNPFRGVTVALTRTLVFRRVLCLLLFHSAVIIDEQESVLILWIPFSSGSLIARTKEACRIVCRQLDFRGRFLLTSDSELEVKLHHGVARGSATAMAVWFDAERPESSCRAED